MSSCLPACLSNPDPQSVECWAAETPGGGQNPGSSRSGARCLLMVGMARGRWLRLHSRPVDVSVGEGVSGPLNFLIGREGGSDLFK